MSDSFTLGDPLVFPGVTISAAAPMRRYALRARAPAMLAAVMGHRLPSKIGKTEGGIACLGPDEFYARLPAGATIADGAEQSGEYRRYQRPSDWHCNLR